MSDMFQLTANSLHTFREFLESLPGGSFITWFDGIFGDLLLNGSVVESIGTVLTIVVFFVFTVRVLKSIARIVIKAIKLLLVGPML